MTDFKNIIASVLTDDTITEETRFLISKCVELWDETEDDVSIESLYIQCVLKNYDVKNISVSDIDREIEYAKYRLDDLRLSNDDNRFVKVEKYYKSVLNNLIKLKKFILEKI